jgi:flagellar biosynthesis protein FlhB
MSSAWQRAGLQMLAGAAAGRWCCVVVAAAVLSGGWNFTLKPLQPKFSKLNPIGGLGGCSPSSSWSTRSRPAAGLVLGTVAALYLKAHWPDELPAAGHAAAGGAGRRRRPDARRL